jgi:hypothetical protein
MAFLEGSELFCVALLDLLKPGIQLSLGFVLHLALERFKCIFVSDFQLTLLLLNLYLVALS